MLPFQKRGFVFSFIAVIALALFYWILVRTDYKAVFESTTGIIIPEATEIVASCEAWGVQAAVFKMKAKDWSKFLDRLRVVSTESEHARQFSGAICKSTLEEISNIGEKGTISGDRGQHEGLVWVVDKQNRQVFWEVWY